MFVHWGGGWGDAKALDSCGKVGCPPLHRKLEACVEWTKEA